MAQTDLVLEPNGVVFVLDIVFGNYDNYHRIACIFIIDMKETFFKTMLSVAYMKVLSADKHSVKLAVANYYDEVETVYTLTQCIDDDYNEFIQVSTSTGPLGDSYYDVTVKLEIVGSNENNRGSKTLQFVAEDTTLITLYFTDDMSERLAYKLMDSDWVLARPTPENMREVGL